MGEKNEAVETEQQQPQPEETPRAEGVSDEAVSEEESAASPAESEAEEEPKKSKGGFQKRIDELTRRYYEENQRRQQIEQQLSQYQQQLNQTTREQSKPQVQQYGDPDIGLTSDQLQAYEQDLAHWYEQGVTEQKRQQEEAERQQREQQRKVEQHAKVQEKIASAREKYPDFEEVVMNPNIPPLSQINEAAYEAMTESENMADVAYYLGRNPHEVLKFQGMSPVQAAMEVAKLERRVAKPAKTSVTKAPTPPPDVGGKSGASSDISNIDDIEAWMRERQRQVQSK